MEVTSLFNFWGGEVRNHLKSLEHPLHWLWDLGRERGGCLKKRGGRSPPHRGSWPTRRRTGRVGWRQSAVSDPVVIVPRGMGDIHLWVLNMQGNVELPPHSLHREPPLLLGGYKPGTLPSCHPYCNYDCSPDLSTLSEQSEPCLTKNRLQKYI